MAIRSVTVVGGSLAGLRSAEALRREGFDGRIRIVAAEDHLPYDRPPLSKQVLAGTWDPDRALLRVAPDLDADWLIGRTATALDVAGRTVTLDDGTRVDGDAVILATGATPRRLPAAVAPPGLAGVHVLRTVADCLALRSGLIDGRPRVAVVGAGFIGSEVAATARALGLDVTVIEALPIPLERQLGPAMGNLVAGLHRDHGIDLRLGSGVAGIRADAAGRVTGVDIDDGTSVEADLVVVGIGVGPATRWLEGSGLTLGDGVVCDSRCRAAPGIAAAGDVARWHHDGLGTDIRVEHWTNASEQGAAAAAAILRGDGAPPYAPVPYFWSDQHGTKIQFIGHRDGDDEMTVVEGSPAEGRFVAAYRAGDRTTAVLLWNRAARLPHWMDVVAAGYGKGSASPSRSPGGSPSGSASGSSGPPSGS